jgi:hypothetical protein
VRAHVNGCERCAALRDRLERENECFAQFYEATALEPSGEAWDSIRTRIAAEARPIAADAPAAGTGWRAVRDWFWRPAVLGQAAFAVALIALSVAATLYFTRRDPAPDLVKTTPTPAPRTTPTTAAPPATDVANQPAPALLPRPRSAVIRQPQPRSDQELIRLQLAKAEREYRGAIQLLDRAIARRRDSLDPNLIRQYESSLALIDDSIAQSRRALQAQPNDVSAGQFLLAAYAKKVELMQDIAMQ